jgi:hypothetical protein
LVLSPSALPLRLLYSLSISLTLPISTVASKDYCSIRS